MNSREQGPGATHPGMQPKWCHRTATVHNNAVSNTDTPDTGYPPVLQAAPQAMVASRGCLSRSPGELLRSPYFPTAVASGSVCLSGGWRLGQWGNPSCKGWWAPGYLIYFHSEEQVLPPNVGDSPDIARRLQDWDTEKNDNNLLEIIKGSMAFLTPFSHWGQVNQILEPPEKVALEFKVTSDASSVGYSSRQGSLNRDDSEVDAGQISFVSQIHLRKLILKGKET